MYHVYAADGFEFSAKTLESAKKRAQAASKKQKKLYYVVQTGPYGSKSGRQNALAVFQNGQDIGL